MHLVYWHLLIFSYLHLGYLLIFMYPKKQKSLNQNHIAAIFFLFSVSLVERGKAVLENTSVLKQIWNIISKHFNECLPKKNRY